MSDKRSTLGEIPWTGGLHDREHAMYVPDINMSEAENVVLGLDGRKRKRSTQRDVMGIIYTASSASIAYST